VETGIYNKQSLDYCFTETGLAQVAGMTISTETPRYQAGKTIFLV
jgi:hypothetical protein